MKKKKKKLLALPVLAVGVLAVFLMTRSKSGPQVREAQELAPSVRVLQVPRLTVRPRAIGYGEARPGRVWQAVPQVGGRIVELSPEVKEGSFAKEEDVLVRIDQADYDLEVQAAESRRAVLRAQLKEINAREQTIRTSLTIEKRSLALAETEIGRVRRLVEDESLPAADLDREERTLLAQTLRVQEIENTLALLEPQRELVNAQIPREESSLAKARLAVERTVIRAPFNCRIGPVSVEQDQVVQPGQVLFSADGTDSSEVTAWLPTRGLRQLFTAGTAEVEPLDGADQIRERLGLEAEIRLGIGGGVATWEAEVVRVRGFDPQTRALGLDVAVANPYLRVVPGRKPPLTRGMYVEVEVRGRPRPDLVVVPRSALHDGVVYLSNLERRLVRRPVTIAFVQSEFAVVHAGLEGGETLVVSDLVPAADGMLLDPVDDPESLAALRADAAGKADPR